MWTIKSRADACAAVYLLSGSSVDCVDVNGNEFLNSVLCYLCDVETIVDSVRICVSLLNHRDSCGFGFVLCFDVCFPSHAVKTAHCLNSFDVLNENGAGNNSPRSMSAA